MRSTVHQNTAAKQSNGTNSAIWNKPEVNLEQEYKEALHFGKPFPKPSTAGSGDDKPTPPTPIGFDFSKIPIFPPQQERIQPKLKINTPGDKYEQEADQVAEQVMQMPEPLVQRKPQWRISYPFHQTTLQRKCEECAKEEEKETLQAKSEGNMGGMVPPFIAQQIQSSLGNGQMMDMGTRSFMETRFGTDFSGVRIHTDNNAALFNQRLQANAFTLGNDIYFNQGQYSPGSGDGRRLLAHELVHTVQQSQIYYPIIQRKGGTFGGFFSNIGRAFIDIFTDEPDFSDEEIKAYLEVLKSTGDIEDDFISDDKARMVVKRWKNGKLELTKEIKVLLIKEMFSGFTGDADEQSILDILNGSPGELTYLLSQIKPALFSDEFHGSEYKELKSIIESWEKRTGKVKTEQVEEVKAVKHDSTKIVGDGSPANEGMTVKEFGLYISQQADWFTEPGLQTDEALRKKLWDVAILIGEGNHISYALGKLKVNRVMIASTGELEALRTYAEGANAAVRTVRITDPHDDFDEIVKWGKAMKELKTFVPDLVLKIVIDQDFLKQLIDGSLLAEFKKYYQDFSPTIENKKEKSRIIELLTEGLAPYKRLKGWMHDLHVVDQETRLKLVDNVKVKDDPSANRTKPVLLFLMSGVDYSSAFLYWANLKSAILNTTNLALVLQGYESLSALSIRVKEVARDYGQISKADSKPKLGQVVIAGHGSTNSIEQTTTGKLAPAKNQKSGYVSYEEQNLKVGKKGDDTEKLVDTLLELLDPKDARIVFAGCEVGSHSISQGTKLDTRVYSNEIVAQSIKDGIAQNPNLRDLVLERVKALKLKNKVQVEAAIATTTNEAFRLDSNAKAELYTTDDPAIGKESADYVQKGNEPKGALQAALDTWATKKYGPTWTTKAMKAYVTNNSASTDWWTSMTRTGYELALPPTGDVNPLVLEFLKSSIEEWFLAGWPTYAKSDSRSNSEIIAAKVLEAESLKNLPHDPKNFPIASKVYPMMLASNYNVKPHLKIIVYQAWMQADASKQTDFLAAVDTTTLIGLELFSFFKVNLIEKNLPALLNTPDPQNPTSAQLKLALTIASNMGAGMPEGVKTFLKNAAGNTTTTTFPAQLKVNDYLDGTDELSILKAIGLAPGEASENPSKKSSSSSSGPTKKAANADLDNNNKNESFIAVQPRKLILKADAPVWEKPDPASKTIDTLKKGMTVRVAGSSSGWAVIDHNGKVAYIDLTLLN